MKTSNKLLVGLFCLILLGMIIFNFSMTKEIKNTISPNTQINMQPTNDSLLIDVDSVAMNNGVSNH